MFITAHLLAGLIIGKLTQQYPAALAGSLLVDLDHIVPYMKRINVLDIRLLWKTAIDPSDSLGDQRNHLHSLFGWAVLSCLFLFIDPVSGVVLSASYFIHLVLDTLDGSDMFPLYPLKFRIIGPINYCSHREWVFTAILLLCLEVL